MRSIFICLMAAIIASSTAMAAYPQSTEQQKAGAAAAATEPKAADQQAPQAKEMSIYGEVQSVNASSGVISVQYYDYDSDAEKTAEIVVGKDTKLENAKGVGDVKKGDWVDVTYKVSDGKNAASMLSVEKEDVGESSGASDAAVSPAGE